MSQSPSVSFPASPPPLFHIRLIPISLRLGYMNASFHYWRNCHIFDTRRNCDMWWISASKLHIVRPILVSVQQKQERERWVQTFLVVKGRNLQLSNKSLRLNPFCDWLRRATWHTLYEHELYAVVYSPFLPLYRQQTKQGHKNLFFFVTLKIITLPSFWRWLMWSSDFLTEGSSGQWPRLPTAACVYPPRRQ